MTSVPRVRGVAEVLRWIRTAPCGWHCTTCGGRFGRLDELQSRYRWWPVPYVDELSALTPDDFREIGWAAPIAAGALAIIERPMTRTRVLDAWSETLRSDPEVALVVLYMAGSNLPLSPRLVNVLAELSQDRSVLAEHLASVLGAGAWLVEHLRNDAAQRLRETALSLEGWEEFQRRADEDAERWRRAWEEEREARRRARAEEVARLCRVPLGARLQELIATSVPLYTLEPELAEAEDPEIERLTPEEALENARHISPKAEGPWQALKQRLVARHERAQREGQRVRSRDREDEIERLERLSPVERLASVARLERRSLHYWPVAWADVGMETAAALPPDVRRLLADRIPREARRLQDREARQVWRRLLVMLRRAEADDPGLPSGTRR